MLIPKRYKRYGKYPCVDYLNNALRSLLKDENPNVHAINEIVFCIKHADGEIHDDVLQGLDEMQKHNETND